MPKLFVIAGHGAGDSGASANGYTEAERVRALANKLKELGGDNVELGDLNRNYYADNGISSLNLPKGTQVVELHLDSASQSARGGHVIINSTFEPDEYDKKLANNIANIFPGRSNTIVKRSDLANPKRAAAKGISYRLLEVCFISNPSDIAKFNSSLDEVARAILSAFDIPVVGTSTHAPAPSPSPSTPPSGGSTQSNFGGTYRCTVNSLNVRSAPSTSASVVAHYTKGQTVVLDNWYKIADGWVWGRYTGASSGLKRYVAVGKPTGGPAADDYLVKI